MKKIKFTKDMGVGIALTLLGVGTTLLSNVKEKNARETLKSEVVEEVMKEVLKEKNQEATLPSGFIFGLRKEKNHDQSKCNCGRKHCKNDPN